MPLTLNDIMRDSDMEDAFEFFLKGKGLKRLYDVALVGMPPARAYDVFLGDMSAAEKKTVPLTARSYARTMSQLVQQHGRDRDAIFGDPRWADLVKAANVDLDRSLRGPLVTAFAKSPDYRGYLFDKRSASGALKDLKKSCKLEPVDDKHMKAVLRHVFEGAPAKAESAAKTMLDDFAKACAKKTKPGLKLPHPEIHRMSPKDVLRALMKELKKDPAGRRLLPARRAAPVPPPARRTPDRTGTGAILAQAPGPDVRAPRSAPRPAARTAARRALRKARGADPLAPPAPGPADQDAAPDRSPGPQPRSPGPLSSWGRGGPRPAGFRARGRRPGSRRSAVRSPRRGCPGRPGCAGRPAVS